MSCPPTNIKFQLRRATSAAWGSTNPILQSGEPGFDTVTNCLKIGDGTTRWNLLPYLNSCGSGSYPSTGNFLRVDSVYGDNTTAASNPYGFPFKTITAAITYRLGVPLTPQHTIFIYPGTYAESFTIPQNTAIRGANTQTVFITPTVTGNTTAITMSTQTRLEDVTVNLLTSGSYNLIGIDVSGTNVSVTSKIRTCVVNVTHTGVNSNTVYGIYAGGTSTSPFTYSSSALVRAITINVSSTTTGATRGIYVTGACRLAIRDTIVSSTGVSDSIGVETTNTGSFVELKTSTIAGTGTIGTSNYDIKQPGGLPLGTSCLQLSATDLIYANANANGFTVNTEPAHFYFAVNGNIGNGTHYLFPGTLDYNAISTTRIGIPFVQRVIVFEGLLSSNVALTGGQSVTINLYKASTSNGVGTLFGTMVIDGSTSTNKSTKFQNSCATFNSLTEYLQVEMITSGGIGNAAQGLFVGLALY